MHRLTSTGVAMLAALASVAVVGAGTAAAATAGGAIALYASPNSNRPTERIVVVGAIGDYGTATSIDKNGKVDPTGTSSR